MMNGLFPVGNSSPLQLNQMSVILPQQFTNGGLLAQPALVQQAMPCIIPAQNPNFCLISTQPQIFENVQAFSNEFTPAVPQTGMVLPQQQQYFQVIQTPQGLQAIQVISMPTSITNIIPQIASSFPQPSSTSDCANFDSTSLDDHTEVEAEDSEEIEDEEAENQTEPEDDPEDPLTALSNLMSSITEADANNQQMLPVNIADNCNIVQVPSTLETPSCNAIQNPSCSSGQTFQVLLAPSNGVPLPPVLSESNQTVNYIPQTQQILTLPQPFQKIVPVSNLKTSTPAVSLTSSESDTSVSEVAGNTSPQLPDSTADLDGQTIKQSTLSIVDGVDLEEIREFARNFKVRRLFLGLTQAQVGQALSETQGPAYSQSAICRFEKLDITPKSASKMKPVLEQWLREAEEKYRQGQLTGVHVIGLPDIGKVRKKRTFFSTEALAVLNAKFERCSHPTAKEINSIASEIGYERSVVRVWFCNKRQSLRNSSQRLPKNGKR